MVSTCLMASDQNNWTRFVIVVSIPRSHDLFFGAGVLTGTSQSLLPRVLGKNRRYAGWDAGLERPYPFDMVTAQFPIAPKSSPTISCLLRVSSVVPMVKQVRFENHHGKVSARVVTFLWKFKMT